MDPANARPRGEQQFPKLEEAGLRLSLECWRQVQNKVFPLHLPFVVPTSPHQIPTQAGTFVQSAGLLRPSLLYPLGRQDTQGLDH